MARPKLQNREEIKVKINLTISPKQKEKLYELAQEKNTSASELFGQWIEKNYKAFQRKSKKES